MQHPLPGKPSPSPSDSDIPGIYTSENVTLDVPAVGQDGRPPPVKYTYAHPYCSSLPRKPFQSSHVSSLPAYHSPLRHHKRAASSTRRVKETLNARSEYSNSEDDGTAQHRINQYLIRQEIGRGSFGAVHLAVDQYGHEYVRPQTHGSQRRKGRGSMPWATMRVPC